MRQAPSWPQLLRGFKFYFCGSDVLLPQIRAQVNVCPDIIRCKLEGFSRMQLRFRRPLVAQECAKVKVRLFVVGIDANRTSVSFFGFEVPACISERASQ